MSLNEHRGYFDCTLWESPKAQKPVQNFEQCWMPGDHFNIGGSWPEQQLADITLAWMMSRFAGLGVKFNDSYLYREYLKFKDFVKTKGPSQYNPYPADLNPRHWGEGVYIQVLFITDFGYSNKSFK